MSKKLAVAMPADDMIIMPRGILEKARSAGQNELKLIIWLYAGNAYDASSAAKALGMTPAEADTAAAFWKGAGILTECEAQKVAAAPNDNTPSYDSDVISDALQSNDAFSLLCDQFADLIGKVLNRNDYNTLYYLFDHCALPSAYIITAAHYCVSKGKRNMRYIQNTILSIYDSGVDDLSKLDEHLASRQKLDDSISNLRTICGIGGRALSAKEKRYFEQWFTEWKMPFETVRLAYERSVDATGGVSFAYMNKILESWHNNGFTTAEQIASGDRKPAVASTAGTSFDADEFFTAALQKSRRDNADDD